MNEYSILLRRHAAFIVRSADGLLHSHGSEANGNAGLCEEK